MWEFGIFIFNFYIAFSVLPSYRASKDSKLLRRQLKLKEIDLPRDPQLGCGRARIFPFPYTTFYLCADGPGLHYCPNPWKGVKENEKGLYLVMDMFVSFIIYLRPVTCKDVVSTKCVYEAPCLQATMNEHVHGDSDSNDRISWNEYMLWRQIDLSVHSFSVIYELSYVWKTCLSSLDFFFLICKM